MPFTIASLQGTDTVDYQIDIKGVCVCGSLIVVALSHIAAAAAASRVIGPNEMFSVHPVSVNNKVKCNRM